MELKLDDYYSKEALHCDIVTFFEEILDVTNLSPTQKVILKAIRSEDLDDKILIPKTHPYQDRDFANEIELFKYLTDKEDYIPTYYADASIDAGRRSGKCLAEGTEVLTPFGPKNIEDMKVGDIVYGYNSDGSISETKVTKVFSNGKKEVLDLLNYGKSLATCTKEHSWLTNTHSRLSNNGTYIERKVKDFAKKDQYIARRFVKIPCGKIKEDHAYAIGVLLGDGGRRKKHIGGYLSSAIPEIPQKISEILNTKVNKNHGKNYTYYIERLKEKCHYYNEWMGDRLAHEKKVDWNIINSWNRETLLRFVAGLLDSDGSVHLSNDTKSINLGFGCQSLSIVEAFQKAFYKLWQHKLAIHTDNGEKYKNGQIYYVNCKSNFYVKMALYELDKYLVHPSRKWKQEYADFPEQRSDDKIGIKLGKSKLANTYDLEIDNDTHLYLLANEGLITHNSTTLGAGLALYYATQFNYIPFLGTNPWATIPIMSPTKEQAGEVFAAIRQFCLKSPYIFQKFLDGKIDEENIQAEFSEEDIGKGAKLTGGQIKFNNKVVIKVFAADVSKIRGMAVPFAILDEACWFGVEGNDTKNTDKAIAEALEPALSQFHAVEGMALILKISSPNGQAGLMFEAYENRKDEDVLHIQAPTWYMNPSISVKYLEKQKKKGMGYFNREYGAQYVASEQSYLDPILVESAIIRGAEQIDYMDGYRYVAAMDYATKDDYWTLAIGHKEYVLDTELKEKKEKIQIDLLVHWKGTSGNELDPSEIVPEICLWMKKYRVTYCITDQYAFAALKPFFMKEGCMAKEFAMSYQSKLKVMYSLQVALNSSVLKMVHNPLAVKHLKDLREKRSNISNKIRIEHAPGTHDDYADVVALVCYQFDKTSPIFIGHHYDGEDDAPQTKDQMGKFVAMPTAQDLAEYTGLHGFSDNRTEHDEKEQEDDDDGSNFWFSF